MTERTLVKAWNSDDIDTALSHLEDVLVRGSSDQRAQALLYRGSIREDQDDYAAAKRDFAEASRLFDAGTYRRYAAELSVAGTCEVLEESDQAAQWYRAAMTTCVAAGEPFSGAAALKAMLRQADLPFEDANLARAVALKSWQALKLAGEPDLENLAETARILLERGAVSPDN